MNPPLGMLSGVHLKSAKSYLITPKVQLI